MSDVLGELRSAMPGAQVITDPDVMESYRRDQTPVATPGQPLCVVQARSRKVSKTSNEQARVSLDCGL